MHSTPTLSALAFAVSVSAAQAQTLPADLAPYAGEQTRPVKALSASEIDDLRGGRGMGLSRAAELNRKPGPRHVLDLAVPLALDDAQEASVQAVFDRMDAQARAIGARIVDDERLLDAYFTTADATADAIEPLVTGIARLQGRLRFVHLEAHLQTARVLTARQIARHDTLRGYDGAAPPPDHHHP